MVSHTWGAIVQNGLPFKIVEIDVSQLDEKNSDWCYTEEEVRQRYGPDEGKEFGNEVQICGSKVPKTRALKFIRSGAPHPRRDGKVLGAYSRLHRHAGLACINPDSAMRPAGRCRRL